MRKPDRKAGFHIGGFETVKVVREFTELRGDSIYGESIGTRIDEHLRACAERHEEVQSLTLHITEEAWNRIRSCVAGEPVEAVEEE